MRHREGGSTVCAHVKLLPNGSSQSYPHLLSQSSEWHTLKQAPHIAEFEVCLQHWYAVEKSHLRPLGPSDLSSYVGGWELLCF